MAERTPSNGVVFSNGRETQETMQNMGATSMASPLINAFRPWSNPGPDGTSGDSGSGCRGPSSASALGGTQWTLGLW